MRVRNEGCTLLRLCSGTGSLIGSNHVLGCRPDTAQLLGWVSLDSDTNSRTHFPNGLPERGPHPFELRAACAAHDPTFYDRFAKWAEEYFWIPHRDRARGVGGIFFDRLEDHFDAHFAFTRDVGEGFLDIFPRLVRGRMGQPFTDADMQELLEFRGRYVEFNLLYDRGTLFGLKTGGNIDAILMSLPPLARWA